MPDILTAVFLAGLAVFAFMNRKKIGAAADALGDLANDTHTDSALRVLKRSTALEIQLLKNRVDDLETKGRSSQPARIEDQPRDRPN